MLRFVIVGVLAVSFVAVSPRLPGAGLLMILGVIGACLSLLSLAFGTRWGWRFHNDLLLGIALFCGIYAWAGFCGQKYLDIRDQLNGEQEWQVEIMERPRWQYGRAKTRLRLVCRYLPKGRCEPIDHPLGQSYFLLGQMDAGTKKTNALQMQPGQYWRLALTLSPVVRSGNPGFDKSRWALSERIVANARIKKENAELITHQSNLSFWRDWLGQRLVYPSSIESSSFSGISLSPVVLGLTLGDRAKMNEQHWQLLRATGTTHLMAISGLHLGILTGWVYILVSFLLAKIAAFNQRVSPQTIACVLALVCGLGYSLMVGFALPTQRALLMLSFGYLGVLSNRPKMMINGLCVALLVIIVAQPFAVLTASLWLSFAAVLLVCWVIANRVVRANNKGQGFYLAMKIQVIIFIGMLPLSVYFFNGVALNSMLANLVAIPVVTLVLLPLCFINGLLVAVDVKYLLLGEWIRCVLDWLFCFLQWLIESFGGLLYLRFDLTTMIICFTGGILLCAPVNKVLRVLGLVLMGACLMMSLQPQSPRVVLYDQPQVFAMFQQDGRRWLWDETPGLAATEGFVLQNDIPQIKTANNQFKKESWQWQGWTLRNYTDQRVAGYYGCNIANGAGAPVSWQSIPLSGEGCAIAFEWQGLQWLLLGAISPHRQLELLESGAELGQYDVVMLSGRAFSGALLNVIKGSRVVLWGQTPLDAAMKQRFEQRGIDFHDVAESGALQITFDGQRLQISSLLKQRFYHLTY